MESTERADELLLEGEHEHDRIELASATVVVTTHRVLTSTPGEDETNVRAVDRSTVGNVILETSGSLRSLSRALVAGVFGCGVLVTAMLVDPSGVLTDIDAGAGATPAADVLTEALGTVETILIWFELALFAGGLLFLAIALFFGVRYARSRSRLLVVRVGDDENLEFPVTETEVEAGVVPVLKRAIGLKPEATPESHEGTLPAGPSGGERDAEGPRDVESVDDRDR